MQSESAMILLNHLHDGVVTSLVWDHEPGVGRRVRVAVTADPESMYEPWRGRTVVVTVSDVVICRFTGYGCQSGAVWFDAVRDGVTPELMTECTRLEQAGMTVPTRRFTMSFGDGSALELVAAGISTQVGTGQ